MSDSYIKYGGVWKNDVHPLQVEMWWIRQGEAHCQKHGRSLSFHYEQFRKICWPKLDDHRWHSLCRDEILKNKVTVLMGPGSSGKTHEAAWIYLVEYWCFPDETCVLVSSTDMRGLRKRIWGELTDLWQQGVDQYDFLGGHLIDSALAIATDDIEDIEYGQRKARDMRKGIFGIPCIQGGKFVGLAKFVGIKQKRMRLIADEASMMGESFLSAFANLNKNEDFRAVIIGNPNDPIDPLGRAAEPAEGWTDDYLEPGKTRVWNTRFMSGRCVNLIGTDSPNFDFPADQPTRYKYLISREKIADTLSFFPKDSLEYYSQCIGSMKIGTMARRVLTRRMCLENKAIEKAVWKTGPTTRVYFVDASYGGDLCIGGSGDIGEDIDGKIVLQFNEPKIIPIRVGSKDEEPEYQIASFVKGDLERQEIPPDCMGHDSTGRGALGTALSKVLGSADTHPIESGGVPSDRPVSSDLFITDEKTGQRRLKLCSEHYDRKVSEFWYQVRYAVESGQLRGLPEECLSDLCTRKWDRIKRDIISVEPKNRPSTDPHKQGMKQRTGKSPDHGDWAAGIVEMARRKGFVIDRLGNEQAKKRSTPSWLDEMHRESLEAIKSQQLQMA